MVLVIETILINIVHEYGKLMEMYERTSDGKKNVKFISTT